MMVAADFFAAPATRWREGRANGPAAGTRVQFGADLLHERAPGWLARAGWRVKAFQASGSTKMPLHTLPDAAHASWGRS